MFQGLTLSPTWGYYWWLGRTKTISFVSTKPSVAHPEDTNRVSSWNIRELSLLDAAACLKTCYWIMYCAVGNKFVYISEVDGRFATLKVLDSRLFATVSSWPKIFISISVKWCGSSEICILEWTVVRFGHLLYWNNHMIGYQFLIVCADVIIACMKWVRWKHL